MAKEPMARLCCSLDFQCHLLYFVLSNQDYESILYGPYIKDLQDDIQQELLHVLFSKANMCIKRKVTIIYLVLLCLYVHPRILHVARNKVRLNR